jgi:hypothetical protein
MESISNLVRKTSDLQKSQIPETLKEPGRLLYESETNLNQVLFQVSDAVVKTAERMGLRTGNMEETVSDFVRSALRDHKTAYVSDILHCLDLASLGKIEKPNQLNVLSVLNLSSWFDIYWTDHRYKYIQKPETKQLPEMSQETKIAEVRKGLEAWLDQTEGERILMSKWFYQKFWDWGILSEANLTKQARREAYNARLGKYALSLPGSILSDPIKRKAARQMIEQCTDDNGKFQSPTAYAPFEKNDLHLLVMEECRNEMLNHFISKQGLESILRQFDSFHK